MNIYLRIFYIRMYLMQLIFFIVNCFDLHSHLFKQLLIAINETHKINVILLILYYSIIIILYYKQSNIN